MLIDALIGLRILPTGVVPVTAVPTVVRYGKEASARVRTRNHDWQPIPLDAIAQYVAEEHNPENAKGIEAVEVFVPSPLLASGMCLVDTPGLGSVFTANTEETKAFLPHFDAVLAVIGVDPPLSADELALLKDASELVGDVLIVLNKADRANSTEIAAAKSFAARVLREHLGREFGKIYEVSALQRLEGLTTPADWGDFTEALERLADHSGQHLTQESELRGIRRIARRLQAIIRGERDALVHPLEETEQRLVALRGAIDDTRRSLRDLAYLFTGEQHRLATLLRDRHQAFLTDVGKLAHKELTSSLQDLPRINGPAFRRKVMAAAQEVTRSFVVPWLAQEQSIAETEYAQTMLRFTQMTEQFLSKIAEAGVRDLGSLQDFTSAPQQFRVRSKFVFNQLLHLARPASPFRLIGDWVFGAVRAHMVIEKDAHRFLDRMLEVNSSRVENDLQDRIADSRQRLEAEIRALLEEASAIAERAATRARIAHETGAVAVEAAIERLRQLESEVTAISQCS